MVPGSGRPRKACSTCKGQKIRCTGERPICKRCMRLKHTCIYTSNPPTVQKNLKLSRDLNSVARGKNVSSTPITTKGKRSDPRDEAKPVKNNPSATLALRLSYTAEERYLGIPESLLSILVEVYYNNVYNADLLLHKRLFLESLTTGTARWHVVLSVCACAANFYRDVNGHAVLIDHGFMIEWAKQAGKLVFQEAEDLHEDNIVTFCNLALFWHSQGSWRISCLHKGNAYQLFYITGIRTDNSWETEIRRRRFWACYLMHCHNSESMSLFQPLADLSKLTLPWPEEDFDTGVSKSPRVTLEFNEGNGGIYSELIKGLTLWSAVASLIKPPESDLGARIPAIHALGEKILSWWRKLRPDFKLTPSAIAVVPHDSLPKILLINILYHQSLCALHASIVPLFSWSAHDGTWSSARQISAQEAFEHACAASTLINAVLSTYPRVSAIPSFIAYAAYSGCAIQIPFMWCSNLIVKERARTNVRANIRMIHTMASYWKFAALLKIHVGSLYHFHQRHPTILENEPKYVDSMKLTSLKINLPHARASILEFLGVLRSERDGYVEPGEENNNLETEYDSTRSASLPRMSTLDNYEDPIPTKNHSQNQNRPTNSNSYPIPLSLPIQENQYEQEELQPQRYQPELPISPNFRNQNVLDIEGQSSDVCTPLFDPEMLNFFPNGDIPDLSKFESSMLSLDYFEIKD